jgi:hypothetical protein
MNRTIDWIGRGAAAAALVTSLLAGVPARADNDSCREWRGEHRAWKTEGLRRYLRGAPQRELDSALFEVLQREAYLTSCDISVDGGRDELVGWRLVDRLPEEYGSAVVESVLERAGFELELRELFEPGPRRVAVTGGVRR